MKIDFFSSVGSFQKCMDLKIVDPIDLDLYKTTRYQFIISNSYIFFLSFINLQILKNTNIFKLKNPVFFSFIPSLCFQISYSMFFGRGFFKLTIDLDEKYYFIYKKYITKNQED